MLVHDQLIKINLCQIDVLGNDDKYLYSDATFVRQVYMWDSEV